MPLTHLRAIVLVSIALAAAGCGRSATSTEAPAPILAAAASPTAAATSVPTATAAPTPAPTVAPTVAPTATALPEGREAPELLGGGAWLNSTPLTLAELRGRVVLVNFWTFGCINCKNTLPYVQQWWEKYNSEGLVIIGVHTPEFRHEADPANVQAALDRLGVVWPVVQDNDYRIWRAYRNNYWPRFYLINRDGRIIYDRIGEGAYDVMDEQIRVALAE